MSGASLLGTQTYFEEMRALPVILKNRHQPFLRNEVLASCVGFGGYRIHPSIPDHREALLVALQSGVNLVDTSTNYTDGGSESLVGEVLSEVASRFPRDHFVIVSKAGYVQGQNLQSAQELKAAGKGYPEMVEVNESCWHCLHPDFLRDQLEQSQKRLGIDSHDVFLLHNPEYYLSTAKKHGEDPLKAREEFYRRIRQAFMELERLRQSGRIRYYGVSSNTLVLHPADDEAVAASRLLEMAVEAAREVGVQEHGFQVLQFPMNPLEHRAATMPWQEGGQTLLQYARQANLDVLFNRPLNAIHDSRMHRLAKKSYTENESHDQNSLKALEEVAQCENEILSYMESHPAQLTRLFARHTDKKIFRMALELKAVLDVIESEDHWAEILHRFVMGHTRASVQALFEHYKPLGDKDLQDFSQRYLDSLARFEEHWLQHLRKKEWLESTSRLFEAMGPDLFSGAESPSAAVIRFLADLEGHPRVLVGMRHKDYVRDATSVLIEEVHPAVPEVLQTLKAQFVHNENPDPAHS